MTNIVLIPDGGEDILINDCLIKREVEAKMMDTFQLRGYMEVSTSTLEYYHLYNTEYLKKYGNKMFKLIDSNGQLLVLRPDSTIPLGRMVATKLKDFVHPIKLCYIQKVFRMDEAQSGKKREYTQGGVEVYGLSSYKADVEVIVTAIESLENLGIKDFKVEIGDVRIINSLLKQLDRVSKLELVNAIKNKSFGEINSIADKLPIEEDYKSLLKRLPTLQGKPEMVLNLLKGMKISNEMKGYIEDIQKVIHLLGEYGHQNYILLDMGKVGHMDYYTGIVFKGYIEGFGRVIFSGGRYDKLMDSFGFKCPAVGFAFMINNIVKVLKTQGYENYRKNRKHYLLVVKNHNHAMASQKSKELRGKGHIVEISIDMEDNLEEYCKKRGIDEVLMIE